MVLKMRPCTACNKGYNLVDEMELVEGTQDEFQRTGKQSRTLCVICGGKRVVRLTAEEQKEVVESK